MWSFTALLRCLALTSAQPQMRHRFRCSINTGKSDVTLRQNKTQRARRFYNLYYKDGILRKFLAVGFVCDVSTLHIALFGRFVSEKGGGWIPAANFFRFSLNLKDVCSGDPSSSMFSEIMNVWIYRTNHCAMMRDVSTLAHSSICLIFPVKFDHLRVPRYWNPPSPIFDGILKKWNCHVTHCAMHHAESPKST